MDQAPLIELNGDEGSKLLVFEGEDGNYLVTVLKHRGSTKFTCRGSDYVAAHQKAFPAPAGPVASGNEAPETRYTF